MKVSSLFLAILTAASPLCARSGQRADSSSLYVVAADALSGGGALAQDSLYRQEGSLGELNGLTSAAAPAETAKGGFLGQIQEVTWLALAANPATIGPGGTSLLSAIATLDDGTELALNGTDIQWAAATFPIASLSAAGLVTAGDSTSNALAWVSGSYLGVPGVVSLAVVTGITNGSSPRVVFGPVVRNGMFIVEFAGAPGATYTIERTDALGSPWFKVINMTAPAVDVGLGIGVFEFADAAGGTGSRFYRTVYPAY